MPSEHISIGKYTLDSLTTAMYNNPLCIYREYIQNAADAIDRAAFEEKRDVGDFEIRITLKPDHQVELRRIIVEDNGCGVPVKSAAKALLSLGNSQKSGDRERGFRGIGRLGGIAYCDTITFTTKAKGESEETQVVWDCKKVQKMLDRSNPNSQGMEAKQLIAECVTVTVNPSAKKKNESFFRVEMSGVRSPKNELMDITRVTSYVAEHAPVPFDGQIFWFGDELDAWLRREVTDYNTYQIFINNSLIKKPYSQTLILRESKTGKKTDELTSYEKFDILDRQQKVIARGWYGLRKDNIGTLTANAGVDSLRVRVGNILIGDDTLVNHCFREPRFNGYLVGEIHVVSPALTPNARRDDFAHSLMRDDFFEGIRRFVEPLVKKIREDSENKSNRRPIEEAQKVITTIAKQLKKGFVGDAAKADPLFSLSSTRGELEKLQRKTSVPLKTKEKAERQIEELDGLEDSINTAEPRIDDLSDAYNRNQREAIRKTLNAIFELYDKTGSAQELVDRIIKKLNRLT